MIKHACTVLFLCLFLNSASAQTTATTPVSDPGAVALANRALQALGGGTALTDITLQGSATYTTDSGQETGTATLVATGNTKSVLTLNVAHGRRLEVRNGPSGVWIDFGRTPHAMASHNCYLDADWFFPALSLAALAGDPTLVITLVGQETKGGNGVRYFFSYLMP